MGSRVGLTDKIPVRVQLNEGSPLSLYLFDIIMDVLAHRIKDLSPRCVLFADDIVLCSPRRMEVENTSEDWSRALEDSGMKTRELVALHVAAPHEPRIYFTHFYQFYENIPQCCWPVGSVKVSG